jgi:hypothetical protein
VVVRICISKATESLKEFLVLVVSKSQRKSIGLYCLFQCRKERYREIVTELKIGFGNESLVRSVERPPPNLTEQVESEIGLGYLVDAGCEH